MMSGPRTRVGARLTLMCALVLALGGCGDEAESPPPSGPFAEALASVGGGGAHGSLGVGWAEPDAAAEVPGGSTLAADALGPNADSVLEAAPALARRYGFDPLAAARLVSVGGSYAFGLRLEGVDAGGLERALVEAGARTRRFGGLELLDIGEYAVVPEALLDLGVNGLGARDAFSEDRAVLAISETARASLLGRGDRLIEEPLYAAAADCLGDVVVARLIPPKLLLSSELGIDLVALGVGADRQEVLCALGGTSERADEVVTTMRASFQPGARDERTGERIGDSIASAEVSTGTYDGLPVVRAALMPTPGTPPGFLFGAAARGSLVALIIGS